MGTGSSHLKKTDSQTDSHYGDDIVVQPLLEALRAALRMQKTCKGGIASRTHPEDEFCPGPTFQVLPLLKPRLSPAEGPALFATTFPVAHPAQVLPAYYAPK